VRACVRACVPSSVRASVVTCFTLHTSRLASHFTLRTFVGSNVNFTNHTRDSCASYARTCTRSAATQITIYIDAIPAVWIFSLCAAFRPLYMYAVLSQHTPTVRVCFFATGRSDGFKQLQWGNSEQQHRHLLARGWSWSCSCVCRFVFFISVMRIHIHIQVRYVGAQCAVWPGKKLSLRARPAQAEPHAAAYNGTCSY
jgi:hypothetical protein